MIPPIPYPDFDAEVVLVRNLVERPSWHRPERPAGQQTDRALRADYRRWTAADVEPTSLMMASLWQHRAFEDSTLEGGWRSHGGKLSLNADATQRTVQHAAVLLHLVALAEGGAGRAAPSGKPVDNLGKAARDAGVAEVRFARIVNTAPSARLDTLGRVFRQIGRAGVAYRIAVPRPAEGDAPDRRSTYGTLRDSRRDDLAALLAFLFTDNAKPAATRWTAGYYHTSITPTAAEAV